MDYLFRMEETGTALEGIVHFLECRAKCLDVCHGNTGSQSYTQSQNIL